MIEPKASTLYRLVHAVAPQARRCSLWFFITLPVRCPGRARAASWARNGPRADAAKERSRAEARGFLWCVLAAERSAAVAAGLGSPPRGVSTCRPGAGVCARARFLSCADRVRARCGWLRVGLWVSGCGLCRWAAGSWFPSAGRWPAAKAACVGLPPPAAARPARIVGRVSDEVESFERASESGASDD